MTLTNLEIEEHIRKIQCCIADYAFKVNQQGKINPVDIQKYEDNLELLTALLDIVKDYKPVDYVYTVNSYIQTEEDQCITNDELLNILEKIQDYCLSCCCYDEKELLKD